jgi:hypothetical protein
LTKSALALEVSTTSPSMPAVLRPALRSVTRRTLMSVLARERSINLCRLRTRGRSPACVAVKIRWRNRRTLPSQARQSMACQSRFASSGPFTANAASNLSGGSGVMSSSSSQAHLTTSARFRVRALCPVSGRLFGTAGGGASHRVPVSRCLSAAGDSLLSHQIPAGELGLPHGRLTGRTAPDPDGGYRVSHA